MAPELFEGKEADARSDIFAFGCVVYEMVTGKRAFGEKRLTPPELDRIVRRCLAQDPEDRWQSMRDVVLNCRPSGGSQQSS